MKNQLVKIIALFAIALGLYANANAQTPPTPPSVPAPPAGAQMGKMTPDQRIEMKVNKMKQQLNLSDDQVAKIKPLLQAEVTARQSGDKQAMKDNHTKMMAEMGKILTPDQLTKYKAMAEQRMGIKKEN